MPAIRDFNTLFGMVEGGSAIREANLKLEDVVAALAASAADQPKKKVKGSVTLVLDIVVEKGVATISASSSAKKPKEDPRSGLLWLTSDGSLTNEHPTQFDMFRPREVGDRQVADA